MRPAPTRPNTPVIWPANTDSELFFTIGAIFRFCTVSTRAPAGRTVRLARAVERVGEVAPDHRLHDARTVELGGVVGHDMLAVAQDGDAVGEQQRLLQRVRDEDDRDAALLQVAHEVEEVLLLLRRQRSRSVRRR